MAGRSVQVVSRESARTPENNEQRATDVNIMLPSVMAHCLQAENSLKSSNPNAILKRGLSAS